MRRPEDAALTTALAERLRALGLGRVVDAILTLAQPAIKLTLVRMEEEANIPLGASKVGGAPDLPPGTEWPTTTSGQHLPFLAQIHLAEAAPFDPEGDLPHSGLLSFFYALNDPTGGLRLDIDPSAWRVYWTPDHTAPLVRLETPKALRGALDSHFSACSVAYTRRLTLPSSEAQAIQRLGFTNDERLAYIEVVTGTDIGFVNEMDLRLLGYPYELEPEPFAEAYRVAHGEPPLTHELSEEAQEALRAMERMQQAALKWMAPPEGYANNIARLRSLWGLWHDLDADDRRRISRMSRRQPTPPQALQAMAERERAIDAEWRLLFQIYSNEEAEMDWAGGGVLHFGIQRAALAARDFSAVWVNLQFL